MAAPAGQTVLFNTRMHSKTPLEDGMALYAFEQTPPMSTYLAAFVVGSLTNVSAIVPGNTPFEEARTVSIWGTPHRCGTVAGAYSLFCKHPMLTFCDVGALPPGCLAAGCS